VLSSEASDILGNFPEIPDFPKILEKCLEYLELLNLTSSFEDFGVSGDFSGVSGTYQPTVSFWVMGINTPHPLPFGAAGSPHEKHISTALLSPPISSIARDLRREEIWVRD
jgi:hypothetical protein